MKLPKPMMRKIHHYYIRPDGTKWMTTAKPGTDQGPGTRWVKEFSYKFKCYKYDDGISVSMDTLMNPTVEELDKVILWLKEVKTYVKGGGL